MTKRDPRKERDERTGSAAAANRMREQGKYVDLQIQQAVERGDFDDLPGARQTAAEPRHPARPRLVGEAAHRARADHRGAATRPPAAHRRRAARRAARPRLDRARGARRARGLQRSRAQGPHPAARRAADDHPGARRRRRGGALGRSPGRAVARSRTSPQPSARTTRAPGAAGASGASGAEAVPRAVDSAYPEPWLVTPVAEAREAYARRDWRAVYDGLLPMRDSLATDDLATLGEATWWLGDTTTSMAMAEDVYQRLRRRRFARARGRLRAPALPRVGHARRRPGRRGVAEPRRATPARPPARAGPRHTPSTSTARSGWTWRASRGRRSRRLPASAPWREQHDDETLACFALVLEGMAAVRRGETAERLRLPRRGDAARARRPGRRAVGRRHLLHHDPPLRGARRPRPDARLDRGAGPLGVAALGDVHVRRRHPRARAAADQRRGRLGRRGGGAGPAQREPGRVRTAGCPAPASTSSGRSAGCAATRPARRAAYARAQSFGIDPQPGARPAAARGGTRGRGARRAAGVDCPSRAGSSARGSCSRRSSSPSRPPTWPEPARSRPSSTRPRRTTGRPGLLARAAQARALIAVADGRPADAIGDLETAAAVYRDQRYRHAVATVHEQLALAHRALGDARQRRRRRGHRHGHLPSGWARAPTSTGSRPGACRAG